MKHVFVVAGAAIAILALAGCAPKMTPAEQAELLQRANKPVSCRAGSECERKWSRVVYWVKQNCDYKFQTVSENVIQTMGPLPNSPSAAFTITKVPVGKGVYSIELDGGCDNIFGCIPSLVEDKASFADFITAK